MKFSCEKALLQSAIGTASRTVAVKSAIPALEGLLVETRENQIRITGYDLKTGVRTLIPANVEEQGALVFSARLFGEIIRRMPDDIVSVSTEKYTVNLRCGMSEFHIQAIDPGEYPDLPSVDYQNSMAIRQSRLRDMINRTSFAISQNEARPIHTGSLFEVEQSGQEEWQLTMVSVDGYRLALRREKLERKSGAPSFQFVVPGAALREVERLCGDTDEPIEVIQGERHIMFKTADVTLVTRRLEGDFLNYRQAVPASSPIQVVADTRRLLSSVERCSLLISEQQKSPLRCTFADSLVQIRTSTALGSAYDECPVEGDGGGLEIGFNNRYLLDALKAVPTATVRLHLNTPVSPCVISRGEETDEDSFTYMVLPVRLRASV